MPAVPSKTMILTMVEKFGYFFTQGEKYYYASLDSAHAHTHT